MTPSSRLAEYISACFTGIWVQSHEHDDALSEVAQLCHANKWKLAVWDVASGLQISGQTAVSDSGGDLTLSAGPILGPFDFRSEALAAERVWLETNWLGCARGP